MVKGCVFDFGGVMTTLTMPDRVRPVVSELGIPWSVLEAGFARYRREMDGDLMTMDEMYARIFRDAGFSVDGAAMARIIEADQASYLYRNEETLAFMRELSSRGFKLGILTNMCSDFARRFRVHFADFIAEASALVISGEERLYKPQRAIYEVMQKRIGLSGDELCFFDDVEDNCRGARELGWQAIRFVSTREAAAEFEKLLAS